MAEETEISSWSNLYLLQVFNIEHTAAKDSMAGSSPSTHTPCAAGPPASEGSNAVFFYLLAHQTRSQKIKIKIITFPYCWSHLPRGDPSVVAIWHNIISKDVWSLYSFWSSFTKQLAPHTLLVWGQGIFTCQDYSGYKHSHRWLTVFCFNTKGADFSLQHSAVELSSSRQDHCLQHAWAHSAASHAADLLAQSLFSSTAHAYLALH